jgi:hypothetical protein
MDFSLKPRQTASDQCPTERLARQPNAWPPLQTTVLRNVNRMISGFAADSLLVVLWL